MLRLFRYGIVGGTGSLLGMGVIYLLTDIFHIYYIVSFIIAFCVSTANNYLWNTLWTFNGYKGSIFGYGKFIITSLITLGITTLFMYILTSILGVWYMISTVLVTLCGFPINFILSRKIVWRNKAV